MGYIYIIRNTVNDKVYIGQTIHSINFRMNQHMLKADTGNQKLYKAMRELGKCNFYIELITEVDNKQLDSMENHYINKYNSINNGYNSVLNGEYQYKIYNIELIDKMLDNIISDYIEGMSFTNLSIKYDISMNTLYKLLYDYIGCRINDVDINITRFKATEIIMYDTQFNPIYYFKSIKDAYNWLCNNSDMHIDKRNTYAYTKRACGCGNIAYGHRWQLASDLVYDGKIFRTKFDKEAYIQGKPAYQPEGKQYWVVDDALDNILNKHKQNIKRCKVCNTVIDVGARLCSDCYIKQRRSNIPDIQTLQELLSQYSYEGIGRMYNVTGKAVRKWADSYGLVESKQRDSSGVTCVELNIHFNTFKEAAEYLINNNYTKNIKQLPYNISQAKKNNKTYKGFHWV